MALVLNKLKRVDMPLNKRKNERKKETNLNWIVWNRTVYMYNKGLGINNLQWLMCHKTKLNQNQIRPLRIFATYRDLEIRVSYWLEGIERRLTKTIQIVKDGSYWEKLVYLVLTTLPESRMRGDLIETFKIMEFFLSR